jgi:hypothetical protein
VEQVIRPIASLPFEGSVCCVFQAFIYSRYNVFKRNPQQFSTNTVCAKINKIKIVIFYFNKQCLKHQVTPTYARIKINSNNIAAKKQKVKPK